MQGEYRGDFTRDTFKKFKHFSRVLKQQGRVDIEADWNEQTAILLHYLQSLAADIIGPYGGPLDENGEGGFLIKKFTPPAPDFQICPGHYYVDGILCEAEPGIAIRFSIGDNGKIVTPLDGGTEKFRKDQWIEIFDPVSHPPATRAARIVAPPDGQTLSLSADVSDFAIETARLRPITSYLTQPDLPDPTLPQGTSPPQLLVYLDIWERHITSATDGSIRESALGGCDTATRAKVVWQVRQMDPATLVTDGSLTLPASAKAVPVWYSDQWPKWLGHLEGLNRGMLKARVQTSPASSGPCIVSPESSYRGAENQLYRVEMHKGGRASTEIDANNAPTFKWSRENGSVTFPIRKLGGVIASLETFGRDERLDLKEYDWVEVVDDALVLNGTPGLMVQVGSINRADLTVTLKPPQGTTLPTYGEHSTTHPLLRRWDQKQGDSQSGGLTLQDGAALVEQSNGEIDKWLNLEDGIQIQFSAGDQNNPTLYRAGDYWLIPARVATGDVEWPKLRDSTGQLVLDEKKQPVPNALPPHGVEHHYAPLAVVSLDSDKNITAAIPNLRRTISQVAQ